MKKLLMVCLALVMGAGIATAAKPAQKKSVTTVFVTDIDCEHCVQKIMNNVPSLGKGIKDVQVDLPKKGSGRVARESADAVSLASAQGCCWAASVAQRQAQQAVLRQRAQPQPQ